METIRKPQPLIATEADRVFWNGVREGKLLISKCLSCGRHFHPRSQCLCGNSKLAWIEAAGTGRVYTYIVYHRAFHPAFANDVPYNVAWIELDEGVMMMSNVADCANDDIRIGMPVRVVFVDECASRVLPKFAPLSHR